MSATIFAIALSKERTRAFQHAATAYVDAAVPRALFQTSGLRNMAAQRILRATPGLTKALRQMESELQALNEVVRGITEASHLLRVWTAETRNALSPVSMLPGEVLTQIFMCGLPGDLPAATEWTEVVSSVCKTWRALATKCPILWSNLCLHWPIARQEAWIQRSGRRNLFIYAEFIPRPLRDVLPRTLHSFPGIQDATGLFHIAVLPLWHEVELRVWGDDQSVQSASAFIKSFSTKVSILKILPIDYDERDLRPISLCGLEVIDEETGHRGIAVSLTELVIYNFYAIDIICVVGNLRILRIGTIGAMAQPAAAISNWMVLLRAARALEVLDTIWTSGSSARHPRVIEPMPNGAQHSQASLVVRNLRSFKVQCADWHVARLFVLTISFPNLQELGINFDSAYMSQHVIDDREFDHVFREAVSISWSLRFH
jgi:hypothetical protein